jgi:hypothetical protein
MILQTLTSGADVSTIINSVKSVLQTETPNDRVSRIAVAFMSSISLVYSEITEEHNPPQMDTDKEYH